MSACILKQKLKPGVRFQTGRRGKVSGLLVWNTILVRTLNKENGAQTEKQIARDGAAGTRRATYPEPREPKRSL